jgi:hypothetical protein
VTFESHPLLTLFVIAGLVTALYEAGRWLAIKAWRLR